MARNLRCNDCGKIFDTYSDSFETEWEAHNCEIVEAD